MKAITLTVLLLAIYAGSVAQAGHQAMTRAVTHVSNRGG